jgi:triosephosphate isomerase
VSERKRYVGGNWKMNTNRNTAAELARGVVDGLRDVNNVDVAVFPPFPYLMSVRAILRDRSSSIKLGAQDVYHKADGAYTGEISTEMLKDCGVEVVLCGHSERRHVLGETDAVVNAKLRAVLDAGLEAILCVGETLDERIAGHTDPVNQRQVRGGLADVTGDQIARVTIAYEPVWAIGTGKTATPDDAQTVHANIRKLIASMYGSDAAERIRIMYGGSVKPSNALELFKGPDIDGGLIGGASLKVGEYVPIVRAASQVAKGVG